MFNTWCLRHFYGLVKKICLTSDSPHQSPPWVAVSRSMGHFHSCLKPTWSPSSALPAGFCPFPLVTGLWIPAGAEPAWTLTNPTEGKQVLSSMPCLWSHADSSTGNKPNLWEEQQRWRAGQPLQTHKLVWDELKTEQHSLHVLGSHLKIENPVKTNTSLHRDRLLWGIRNSSQQDTQSLETDREKKKIWLISQTFASLGGGNLNRWMVLPLNLPTEHRSV